MAKKLTVQIVGDGPDDAVRLTSFIDQMEAIKDALRQTERVLYGSEGSVFYRITGLSKNSPATITIEAVSAVERRDNSDAIVSQFFEYLDHLSEGEVVKRRPELDLPALEAYKKIAPSKKRHISRLVVGDEKDEFLLDEIFATKVADVIGPDEISLGEVVGTLEVLNLHNKMRFEIYPTSSAPKVVCNFASDLKSEVIAAIDRYVRVHGVLRFKRWAIHPHAVDVQRIEAFPPEDDLPTLDALKGIAPDLTGGELPENFLRRLRDENW